MDPMMIGVLLIIVMVAVYYFAAVRPKNNAKSAVIPATPVAVTPPVAPAVVLTPVDISSPTKTSEPYVPPQVVVYSVPTPPPPPPPVIYSPPPPPACNIAEFNYFLKLHLLDNNWAFDVSNAGGCPDKISYKWAGYEADPNNPWQVTRNGISMYVNGPVRAYDLLLKDNSGNSILGSEVKPVVANTCDIVAYNKYIERIMLGIPFSQSNIAGCPGTLSLGVTESQFGKVYTLDLDGYSVKYPQLDKAYADAYKALETGKSNLDKMRAELGDQVLIFNG